MRLLGLGAMLAVGLMAGAAAAADTTITFRFNDPEGPQMRQALDQFQKANPGIEVELQRISWGDAREQFVREAATGAGPDVLQLAFVWPRSLGAAGALLPLDDLIKKTGIGVAGWDQFVSRNLAYGPDGRIYGIPFTTDTFALVYNKELLAAAGVTEMPTSWAGLRKASKAIYEKTGKAGFGFPAGSCGTPTIWFLLNFYWWSHGWAIIDQKPDGTYFMNITPAQIAEGFDYYNQFLKDGDNPKANLAICLWGAPEIVEGMVNGSRTFFGGRMIGINANTSDVDAAWKLVRFLAQPDPLFTKYYTNYVQAQRPLMSYTHLPEEIRAGYDAQLKTARSWGAYSTGPVAIPFMWNAVGRAAGSVFVGSKTSADSAQELYDAIRKEFEKNSKS